MNDTKIFKICLATTIMGIISLIIFSPYVEVEQIKIKDITKAKIDESVNITATVESVTTTKTNTTIMKISDETSTTTLVVFPSQYFNKIPRQNDKINCIAKVSQYNGQLELILEDTSTFHIIA